MTHAVPSRRLTRRTLLVAGGAVGLGALAAACGSSGDAASGATGTGSRTGAGSGSATPAAGPWSFTDDRKKTASLKSAPTRVVAYTGTAAALYDFGAGDRITGVFGPTRLKDGKPDVQAGDLDIDRVTVLGNAWGEFNLEKYAALRPELLVTDMWEPDSLWYVPDGSKDKILALAPSVALDVAKISLPEVIGRHAELAEALGADLKAERVTAAKARFEAAAESLRKAAKQRGGVKVMAASASPELLYLSDPRVYPDLSYFRSLGVEFVVPQKVTGSFFENLSWEKADSYPADLILLDNRTGTLQPKDLASKPAWSQLPAVKAGQVTPWLSEPRFSYAGCAPLVETLAKALGEARKV
ncbi:ABC transporter substrate-binding protein [Peterkaempfera bronchialis]|uniref:ABC transporter substrate-binding protein n=1 Tax=Peterkaempfera bronchialis TaxID=2126346 RepID=A0A345SUI6_9ACTN|nr:ABC transporter substrate-binding protein [Peterkaempfera bronchialis]AXI77391.1 ABC transporter substrate-binding protein [Peterkaempfera bronchialis]